MEDKNWKAECDANDLLRVEELKMDKKRMAAALKYIGKKKDAINSIDDLRDKYDDVVAEETKEEEKEDPYLAVEKPKKSKK